MLWRRRTPTIGMLTIARTSWGFSTNSGKNRSGSAAAIKSGLRLSSFVRESGAGARTAPHLFTIGETDYLLIELSNYSVPTRLSECFTRLGDRGLTPILTHPERNPILQQTPQRMVEWAEQGCLIQVTGSALTGQWGERPELIARWLLDRSAVHILASDAHDTKRRIPNLSAARDVAEKIVGAAYAEALVRGQPGRNRQRDADSLLSAAGADLARTGHSGASVQVRCGCGNQDAGIKPGIEIADEKHG